PLVEGGPSSLHGSRGFFLGVESDRLLLGLLLGGDDRERLGVVNHGRVRLNGRRRIRIVMGDIPGVEGEATKGPRGQAPGNRTANPRMGMGVAGGAVGGSRVGVVLLVPVTVPAVVPAAAMPGVVGVAGPPGAVAPG